MNPNQTHYFCKGGFFVQFDDRCFPISREDKLTMILSSLKDSGYMQVHPQLQHFKAFLISSTLNMSDVQLVVSFLEDQDPLGSDYERIKPLRCKSVSAQFYILGEDCFNFGAITLTYEPKTPAFIYIQLLRYPGQYRQRDVLKTWTEAREACKRHGGYLPIIRDKNELQNIVAMAKFVASILSVLPFFVGIGKKVSLTISVVVLNNS